MDATGKNQAVSMNSPVAGFESSFGKQHNESMYLFNQMETATLDGSPEKLRQNNAQSIQQQQPPEKDIEF